MMKTVAALLLAALCAAPIAALAKLPAPSPEAKAKADEAKAKTAWSDKVSGFQLCKAQDRVATHYKSASTPAGAKPAPSACVDPGPFVYDPNAVPAPAAMPAVAVAPAPVAPQAAAAPATPAKK